MKKCLLIILSALLSFPLNSFAQDDDIYFVPSKSKKSKSEKKRQKLESDYSLIDSDAHEAEDLEYDNWAEYRYNGSRDVDEYNRRKPKDNAATSQSAKSKSNSRMQDMDDDYSGTYTARIVRFHSPTIGVYVSSPYYTDYIDIWYDPWYYDPWYGYTYAGWNRWYYSNWYWHNAWYWHDPWHWHCYPHYGCFYPHYHGYYPSYRPIPNGAHRGPHGGYVNYSSRNNSSFGSNRYNSRPSRDFNYSSNRRPSRDFINGNRRPSRDFGNSMNRRPSREFGNSQDRRPSRDFDRSNSSRRFNHENRPSREFTPSRTPSRSFNDTPRNSFNRSGGGRNGSGRSFGGRR